MAGSKSNQRQRTRSRSPRRHSRSRSTKRHSRSPSRSSRRSRSPGYSKSQYRETKRSKDLFKSDRFESSKNHRREAVERNRSPELNYREQEQLGLICELERKLNFSAKQNSEMICKLNAMTSERDAYVRKCKESDSASQLLTEKLKEQEQANLQHIVRLAHAVEINKSKDDKITELEASLKFVKEENQKLKNEVNEKHNHAVYYNNKSNQLIARAEKLETEVEEKRKEIHTMNCDIQAKDRRIQELISQMIKVPKPENQAVQVNSLLETSVESALEKNQENIGDEDKENVSVDFLGIDYKEKVSFIQIAQNADKLNEKSLCSSPNASLTFSDLPSTLFRPLSIAQNVNYSNKHVQKPKSYSSKQRDSVTIDVITID